jgi:hypothetical protein
MDNIYILKDVFLWLSGSSTAYLEDSPLDAPLNKII